MDLTLQQSVSCPGGKRYRRAYIRVSGGDNDLRHSFHWAWSE